MKKQPFLLIATYVILFLALFSLIPKSMFMIFNKDASEMYRSFSEYQFQWYYYFDVITQSIILLILLVTSFLLLKGYAVNKKVLITSLILSAFSLVWNEALMQYYSLLSSEKIAASGVDYDPIWQISQAIIEIAKASVVAAIALFFSYQISNSKQKIHL